MSQLSTSTHPSSTHHVPFSSNIKKNCNVPTVPTVSSNRPAFQNKNMSHVPTVPAVPTVMSQPSSPSQSTGQNFRLNIKNFSNVPTVPAVPAVANVPTNRPAFPNEKQTPTAYPDSRKCPNQPIGIPKTKHKNESNVPTIPNVPTNQPAFPKQATNSTTMSQMSPLSRPSLDVPTNQPLIHNPGKNPNPCPDCPQCPRCPNPEFPLAHLPPCFV